MAHPPAIDNKHAVTFKSNNDLPLLAAAEAGQLDVLMHLIGRASTLIDIPNSEGETALMKASSHNRPDVVRFLLDRHANVNHSDHHGWTALHSSVSSGNEEIAWLLINAGADVNARSRDGLTPLMAAVLKGHSTIVRILVAIPSVNPLLTNRSGDTALDLAATSVSTFNHELVRNAMLEWTHRPQPKGKGRSFNPDIVHPVAPRMPPPNSVIEEVFEYERRIPTAATFFLTPTNPLSGFSSLDLTPADLSSRGPLWSRNQHTAVASLESVQLPDGPHSPSGDEWIWCSGWMLDTMRPDVDQLQGWQYSAGNIGDESDYLGEHRLGSTSHQRLHSRWVSNPHMLATGSIFKQVGELNLVRRRRWIRVRRRLASRHNDVLTVEPGPGQEDPVQTTVSPNGVLPVSQGDQSDISMPTRSPGLPSAKEPPSGSNSPKSPLPISPPAPQRNLSGLNGNPAHNDRLRQSRSPWRPPPVPVKEASARWTTFQQPSSSHSSFPLPLSDFFLVGANSRTSPAKLFSDLAATVTTATQGALNRLAGAVEGAVVTALNAVGLDDEEPEWTALSYDTQLQPRPQATPATKGSANLAGEPGNGDGSAAVLTERESSGTMGECPVCHLALNKLREQPPCRETGLDAADSHVAECLRKGTNGAGSATAQPRGSRFVVQTLPKSVEGAECIICFHDMEAGQRIARLDCLCIYHERCIKAWFRRKKSCPLHYL